MSLAEAAANLRKASAIQEAVPGPSVGGPKRTRTAAPKGFEPGVRYDDVSGRVSEVAGASDVFLADEASWKTAVAAQGYDVQPHERLVLIETRFDQAAWHRDSQGEDAVTRPKWWFRFKVVETSGTTSVEELFGIIDKFKPGKPITERTDLDTYTVGYADLQIGKYEPAVGGTPETIKRVKDVTAQAIAEYKRLARLGLVGPVALIWPGDGCEGFVSQNSRLAWRTDLAPSEMVRVYRRLMTWVIQEWAKVAPKVHVITVGGNHDEAAPRTIATHHADSWDVEAASAIYDAMLDNDKYANVTFQFPSIDKDVVTCDLSGTIIAVAHGHQMKGGAEKWWAGQAHGMLAAGEATVLFSGHFHHLRIIQSGAKTWIQFPSLDNGSEWWARETGASAPSGLFACVVGRGTVDYCRVFTCSLDSPTLENVTPEIAPSR